MPHVETEPTTQAPMDVQVWDTFDYKTAEEVGALMPLLDADFPATSLTEEEFNEWFRGPRTSIIIGRVAGRVAVTATMNATAEPAKPGGSLNKTGLFGGFVASVEARGTGVAEATWNKAVEWCRERGLPTLSLDTEPNSDEPGAPDRRAAIRFYERMGARPIPGNPGHYVLAIPELTHHDQLASQDQLPTMDQTPQEAPHA